MRRFIKYWLPVLLWMLVIFSASGDGQSYQTSSRIIGPIVRWLFPDISEEALNHIVWLARKCAHVAEFGILALLLWRALRQQSKTAPLPPWSWRATGAAAAVAFAYAATDELHQGFVSSRNASGWDVLLDTTGAVLALLLLRAYQRRRERKQRKRLPKLSAPA